MPAKKLFLVFWWHMHQPLYKDPISEEYILPWTFLHSVKDYYTMPHIASLYNIKINFNLTPVLIDQIEDYEKDANCLFIKKFLEAKDKEFLKKLIDLLPLELAQEPIKRAKGRMEEISDAENLYVWYLLSWFPEENKILKGIKSKAEKNEAGEEDRKELIKEAKEIIKKIIPEYKKISEESLSTSPYYHPIIPLLIDIKSALETTPDIELPKIQTNFEEDAKLHVLFAVEKYEKTFGKKPFALWPSEGAVSSKAIKLFSEYGIKIIGTDEDVLFNSLKKREKKLIYKRYKFENTIIIFRDKELSDLIGFSYQKWDQKSAVYDFLSRLKKIYEMMDENHIVAVILDGENCWEYYPQNGKIFLTNLYAEIEKNRSWIETLSLKDALERDDIPLEEIGEIKAGSWIYGNFLKWIGHPEKNGYWEELAKVKAAVKFPKRNLLVAEGSDWFWWQGETHMPEFDALFKNNLKKALQSI